MRNYRVYEDDGDTPYEKLNSNSNIMVGDTIEYFTNNQEGYKKYLVTSENGNKGLKLIKDYYGDKSGGKKNTPQK
jgi:hypothetical protein